MHLDWPNSICQFPHWSTIANAIQRWDQLPFSPTWDKLTPDQQTDVCDVIRYFAVYEHHYEWDATLPNDYLLSGRMATFDSLSRRAHYIRQQLARALDRSDLDDIEVFDMPKPQRFSYPRRPATLCEWIAHMLR